MNSSRGFLRILAYISPEITPRISVETSPAIPPKITAKIAPGIILKFSRFFQKFPQRFSSKGLFGNFSHHDSEEILLKIRGNLPLDSEGLFSR